MATNTSQEIQTQIPLVENVVPQSSIPERESRTINSIFNAIAMVGSEAYIRGLIPDPVIKLLLKLSANLCYRYFPSLLISYEWLLRESDRLAEGSEELMAIQYNLPEALFTAMLGEGELLYPKYTMALWDKGAKNLEQAQIHMLEDALQKANIQDGDEVLDLGCGWGSAAHYILSKFPNARVTSLNLSHEQCEYIRKKMQDPKSYLSSDRFTLCEQDFNEATFQTKFDKIIAIGLFEHIGNLTKSFQKLSTFLKDDGKVFIHIITTTLPFNVTHPFINKYIFPNMRVWNYNTIPARCKNLKTVSQWYLNGTNYAKTLRGWLKNFDENQTEIKELKYGINYAKFRRMWRLYLLLCIAHFDAVDGKILGNGQYLLVHA